jgi:SagB-type dehydrogenase family enzyme
VQELLANCEPGLRAVLERLCSSGATEPELIALFRSNEPAVPLPSLFFHLRMLERWGLLRRTLVLDETELATLLPMTPAHEFALPELAEDQPVVLSRFALLRRDPALATMVLESPTSHARILVHDRRALLVIHELATNQAPSLAQLRNACADLPFATLALLVRLLLGNGFVRTLVDGRTHDESPTMLTWSFADLLFHSRSRIGRHDQVVGKSYPFRSMIDPLPAVRPVPEGPQVPLPRPDLERLLRDDRSFTAVLESRTSIRQHGDPPIGLAQLGELLYRSARVRKLEPSSPYSLYEFTNRPLPGGGGCYELEIYLAIDRCVGLERGAYHYDPLAHRLTQVAGPSAELDELLHRTGAATATGLVAQVLVCIAARFQRMAWPYENMAYATTLKNVGVLMQTLYLVATAMELAPCAMGYGDSDLFARVAKTDYFQETTVGEFLLGSRPT